MPIYLLQGCGVSLICQKGPMMLSWILEIIERGGVPKIQILSRDSDDVKGAN